MKAGLIVMAAMLLPACSERVHDMAYYASHAAERKATLEACNNNPGEKRDDPNCINASEAQWRSGKLVNDSPTKGY